MDRTYNQQLFKKDDKEQVKQFYKFLEILMQDSKEHYNDIHICQDDFYYIVEWFQNRWQDDFGTNKFWDVLEYDDAIYTEIKLPDNTYQWIPKGTKDEFMKKWLEENPGWVKDEYGVWYNTNDGWTNDFVLDGK